MLTEKHSRAAVVCLWCFFALPFLTRAANPPDAPPVILIQNATILTVSHGTIEHGSILIKDGKIAEVGTSIKAPKDAQVFDAAGQFVIPGTVTGGPAFANALRPTHGPNIGKRHCRLRLIHHRPRLAPHRRRVLRQPGPGARSTAWWILSSRTSTIVTP